MSPSPLRHLDDELAHLDRRGLLRVERAPHSAEAAPLVLCSNDYLGYAARPWPRADVPSGAGASRLVSGQHDAHARAEAALGRWLGAEAALLFSSGYAANVGTLAALAGPGDVVISDALNHASIIDGCRLSGARIVVAPHLDPSAVDGALAEASGARRRWVVTESYFGMDGDIPDLAALRRICDAQDAALVVDEAHALGVFGPAGRGLCAEAGVRPDVLIGTLGKALGLQGAFVVGSGPLRQWLWNRARSFVFSTGVSPALAEAATCRVVDAAQDEGARATFRARERQLRDGLAAIPGIEIVSQRGPVLPWVAGPAARATELAARLLDRGIQVTAIRPPTVPEGTSRLRITVTAALSEADIARALDAFRQVAAR